ncbi:hypothetical protein [Microcella sp.]|uniref:hypothetical protein n=1 Tax=Microcella sp. TaxID=1913979 RepID=UPI003918C09F
MPTVTGMIRRLALVALPLALVAGALTACTESTRIPPAEPTADVAPLFATDEEALAAATAAYEEFLRVSSMILQDGGADPERLRPLVSDEVFESEAEGFEVFATNGYRAIGESTLVDVRLQQHISGAPGSAEVQIYACVFVGDVEVVDESGANVVSSDRVDYLAYEAILVSEPAGNLIVEDELTWPVGDLCDA